MKLYEITGSKFLTDPAEIKKWIRENCISGDGYDGIVLAKKY